jgi:2-dehydropantoate 2-reductase
LLSQLLPPVVKDDGVVLVMQNGLGMEAQVAKIVGAQHVVGGLCFLCSNKVGPGHIRHLGYTLVALGEFATRGISERMRAIADDFRQAEVETELAEDLDVARWQKLVWNIPYNGLSVVLDATTKELMTHPQSRRLVEAIMREIVADARLCGAAVTDDVIARMLSNTEKMTPYRTSMKIDYDDHRPLEIEAIFGNPLRAVQQGGAASPLLEQLYAALAFLDARNVASPR